MGWAMDKSVPAKHLGVRSVARVTLMGWALDKMSQAKYMGLKWGST